jgi:hypothetical protein
MKKEGKKGVVQSTLIYWLIAIVALVIIIVFSVFLKDKLFALGDYIKNLFRGG